MPQMTDSFVIDAPASKVAELARTAVARGGWRIDFINTELCELAANFDKSERMSGIAWHYSYHLVIRWESVGEDSSSIELAVTEKNYQWTGNNCRERLQEIASVMIESASRYQRVKDSEQPRTKYGSARWGTLEDIKEAGYWGGVEDIQPDGRLLISPGEDDEIVSISEDDTIKHAIVVGPTGTGKSSSIFIPNLIARFGKSALVTEARAGSDHPDLYWKTARYRAVMGGQQIYHFDPDDLTSHRVNPLDGVRSYEDAQNLAWLIVENTTGKNNYGDDVWPKSEANMLTTLIAHAAALDLHLGYIRVLLREGPDGMEEVLKNSPVEQVREDYRGFMNTSREGFRYGVVASLITRLGIWASPKVVALTEKTDFDINDLPNQKFTFYLSVPANKNQLKPVAALVFNYLLNFIQDSHFEDPPFLLLDEFTNFGRIPGINQKLSIIRHQKISFMLGFQDFAQLDGLYEQSVARDLRKQPRTRIFFRPADYEPAEAISKMAGKTTVFERTVTSSGQIAEKEMGRWLIEPSEVMNLDEKSIIVFTPGTPPLKLPKYDWRDFEPATVHPPPPRPELKISDETIYFCREAKRKNDWQKQWEEAKLKEEEQKKASSKEKKSRKKSGSDRRDTGSSRTRPKKDQGAKSDVSDELKVKKDRKPEERKAEEKQPEPSAEVVHEPDHAHNQNQEVEKESGFRPSPDFDL